MKNKLAIVLAMATVVLHAPSIRSQANDEVLTDSQATFATVDSRGVIPVADRQVLAVPCVPINGKCQEIIDYLSEKVSKTRNLDAPKIAKLDERIRAELEALPGVVTTRTSLSGTAKITCKTQNCLVYTSVLNNENNLFWVVLHPQSEDREYAPSRAIAIRGAERPEEITKLYESMRTLRSSFSAGLSYSALSSVTSPFINALSEAQKYKADPSYSKAIQEAETIERLLPVLSTTWEIYVKSSRSTILGPTHNVSCSSVKKIRDVWNSVLGHEDIREIKGGLLGCLSVDLGEFKTRNGKTTWPEYMISRISREIDSTSALLKINAGSVPDIQIQQALSADRASQF
jgi:hypothetical protein